MFSKVHVPDIASTYAGAELKTENKGDVIAELITTCRELDEVIRISTTRKLKLEETILTLKRNTAASVAEEAPEEEASSPSTHSYFEVGPTEEGSRESQ